jgi:L-rhamnose mutarotase
MQLKPGALSEYARRHATPWPELMDEIGRQGVRTFSIFLSGESDLFVYSEVDAADSWHRVWATAVHQRWGAEMDPLLVVDERGAPRVATMKEIFHFRRPET